MTFNKTILHQKITFVSLVIAVTTLPFSVFFCHAALIVLIANWAAEGNWKYKWQEISRNFLLWPFALFLILNVAGMFYSDDLKSGIFSLDKKAFFFILPFILATTKIDASDLRSILKWFVGTCVVAIIICLATAAYRTTIPLEQNFLNFGPQSTDGFKSQHPDASVNWHFFSYQEFSSAVSMTPTYLGLYVLFSILIIFYLATNADEKQWPFKFPIIVLLSVLSVIVIFLSARIIIVCYFTFLLILFISSFKEKKLKFSFVLPLIAIIISLATILTQPITRYRTFQEVSKTSFETKTDTVYALSTGIRLSLWWIAVKSISQDNLLLGVGPGDTDVAMKNTSERFHISNVLNSYDPHNQFLKTTLSSGLIGLCLLLLCLVGPFFLETTTNKHFLYKCFLLMILLICLTESLLEIQKGIAFFSIFNSLLVYQFQPVSAPSFQLSNG
jgi:O-antigen ligase